MTKLVYVAGPLFSEAERTFLECMVSALAEASGLDLIADFFLPHRDEARYRVHVAQQHDLTLGLGIADDAHDVACCIALRMETAGLHLPDQVVGDSIFLPGRAGD